MKGSDFTAPKLKVVEVMDVGACVAIDVAGAAEVAATREGTLSKEVLFMLLRDSNNGLTTGVATVMLVVGVDCLRVWIGAALTVLDGVTVRSTVCAGARVETALEAGGRTAAWVDREASEVVLPTGAAEAEETTWVNRLTEGASGVDE